MPQQPVVVVVAVVVGGGGNEISVLKKSYCCSSFNVTSSEVGSRKGTLQLCIVSVTDAC